MRSQRLALNFYVLVVTHSGLIHWPRAKCFFHTMTPVAETVAQTGVGHRNRTFHTRTLVSTTADRASKPTILSVERMLSRSEELLFLVRLIKKEKGKINKSVAYASYTYNTLNNGSYHFYTLFNVLCANEKFFTYFRMSK